MNPLNSCKNVKDERTHPYSLQPLLPRSKVKQRHHKKLQSNICYEQCNACLRENNKKGFRENGDLS